MELNLGSMKIVSCSQDWQETFNFASSNYIYKLLKLQNLEIIWNTGNNGGNSQHILCPVSGVGKVKISKKPSAKDKQTESEISFEDISLRLDEDQYGSILLLTESFLMISNSMKVKYLMIISIAKRDQL